MAQKRYFETPSMLQRTAGSINFKLLNKRALVRARTCFQRNDVLIFSLKNEKVYSIILYNTVELFLRALHFDV